MKYIWILFCACGILTCAAQTPKSITKAAATDSMGAYLVHVNKIYIVGNDKTHRSIILREMNIKEDEYLYSNEFEPLIKASRNNVYNTNLFSTVEIEALQLDSTEYDLLIKLQERWYFYLTPVFKLTDRNFNDWWVNRERDLSRVQYGFRMHQYNFRGRNERLKMVGLFGFEKVFDFGYRIPYIEPSQRHGLDINLNYAQFTNLAFQTEDHLPTFMLTDRIQRETYGARVVHSYRNSFYNYFSTQLGAYSINVSDSVVRANPNYFGNGQNHQRAFLLSHTFNRDLRDNRNYPNKGFQLNFSLEKVGLGIFNDVDIWRLTGFYNVTWPLKHGFYANVSTAGQLSTKDVPYHNYMSLGFGNYIVRGYELDVIEGYQNFLTKNSVRKLLFKGENNISRIMPIDHFQRIPYAVYAKVFFDGGIVNNYPGYEQSSRLTNRFLYGLGVGLDIVTFYDFIMRLEYSYNAEGQYNFFINFQTDL